MTAFIDTAGEEARKSRRRGRARRAAGIEPGYGAGVYGLLYRDVGVVGPFITGSPRFQLRLPVVQVGRYQDLKPRKSDLLAVVNFSGGTITCRFTRT